MSRRRRRARAQRIGDPNLRLSVRKRNSFVSRVVRSRRLPGPLFYDPRRADFESPPRRRVGRTVAEVNASLTRSAPVRGFMSPAAWTSPGAVVVGRRSTVRNDREIVDVRRVRECVSRQRRKEVLHALRRVGRGSGSGPRRPKSEVKC